MIFRLLAAPDCRSKNIRVLAIIITELKFRDVKRHIFGRHFVERADHATLEDRPEAFNRVRVDSAYDVLMPTVINAAMGNCRRQILITGPSVCRQQANFVGTYFIDKIDCRLCCYAFQNTGHDIALSLNGADDRRLVVVMAFFLIPMTVLVFASNERFVHLNDAAQLINVLHKRRADFVAHSPRGFVGAKSHVTHDLQCAHALFAGEHEVSNLEPVAERLVCVLKNRARNMRETIAAFGRALITLPRPRPIRQFVGLLSAAARAANAIGPAARDQIGAARFLIREHLVELAGGHLMDGLGSAGHRIVSLTGHKRSVP